jgi:osmotically-inducible protein OsmY
MTDSIPMRERSVSRRPFEGPGVGQRAPRSSDAPDGSAGLAGVESGASSDSKPCRRIAETIVQELRATGQMPLWDVEVSVAEGSVTLRGNVPTYYLKQLAQAIVLATPGVAKVHNDLNVL